MKRYGTVTKGIRTETLKAILNDPYTRGVDGEDYGPIREELEQELWRRQDAELVKMLADYERNEKARMKEIATAHKRKGVTA
jgi:hypothetical protein